MSDASNKSLRDSFIRSVSLVFGNSEAGEREGPAAKELIGSFFSWAGKSKDDVVQIIGKEIGNACVALLREPLQKLMSGQRLQITFELVPKDTTKHPPKREADPPHRGKHSRSKKQRRLAKDE